MSTARRLTARLIQLTELVGFQADGIQAELESYGYRTTMSVKHHPVYSDGSTDEITVRFEFGGAVRISVSSRGGGKLELWRTDYGDAYSRINHIMGEEHYDYVWFWSHLEQICSAIRVISEHRVRSRLI